MVWAVLFSPQRAPCAVGLRGPLSMPAVPPSSRRPASSPPPCAPTATSRSDWRGRGPPPPRLYGYPGARPYAHPSLPPGRSLYVWPSPRPFGPLDRRDLVERLVECGGQLLVHVGGVIARDSDRPVAVAVEQRFEFFLKVAWCTFHKIYPKRPVT